MHVTGPEERWNVTAALKPLAVRWMAQDYSLAAATIPLPRASGPLHESADVLEFDIEVSRASATAPRDASWQLVRPVRVATGEDDRRPFDAEPIADQEPEKDAFDVWLAALRVRHAPVQPKRNPDQANADSWRRVLGAEVGQERGAWVLARTFSPAADPTVARACPLAFRPFAGYDYARPPHPGVLFYQRFQWVWPRHPRVDYTPQGDRVVQ